MSDEQLSVNEEGNPVSVLIQPPFLVEQLEPAQEDQPTVSEEKPAKSKTQEPVKTSELVSD